jgi:hypothetical protein
MKKKKYALVEIFASFNGQKRKNRYIEKGGDYIWKKITFGGILF